MNEYLPQGTPDRKLTLCPLMSNMCPTVEFHGSKLLIQDDYGGAVVLEAEQWRQMVEQVKV